MLHLQRVSGVWTFLLAIFLAIGAGILGYILTSSFLVTLGITVVTLLAVVFAAQWL